MHDPNTWWVTRFARRLRRLATHTAIDAAMDDEMRYHIERETAERISRGMSPAEARRSAARDFGGVERHKEDARDERGLRFLHETVGDAGFAMRVLRRNPGHALAVVLTLALGLGCTAAIFSVVNGILVAPLPYASPQQLVVLWERNVERTAERNVVSVPNFEAWRQRTRSFTDVVALVPAPVTLDGAPSERITGAQVSPGFFRLLGVRPAHGRDFTRGDELNGGADVVILSDAFWRRRFGADSSIVGRRISLDGTSNTVIGVMPASFDPPRFGWMAEQPFWMPFGATPGNRGWGRFLHVVARLRPSVTIEQARAEMTTIAADLSREVADDKEWSASVVRLSEQITGDVRRPLVVVFCAVLLLLGMSAVNVASLVSTFTLRRRHELAIRRAIGASRSRLLRHQLAHAGTLGAIGLVGGILVALVATRLLIAGMPPDVPRLEDVRVNGTVILFAVAMGVATTAIVGGVAAFRAINLGPSASTLNLSSNRASAHLDGSRVVTAEVAISVLLSVMAALMVRSFANLRGVDLGFDASAVVAGRISLPSSRYATDEQRAAFFDQLLRRARSLPGVSVASVVTTRPFACCAPTTPVSDPAQARADVANAPTTDVRFADDSYFSAMRIPVVAGRVFDRDEAREGPPRAVVSRALARALWGTADPVGRSVTMGLWGTTMARVIGVVGDVHLVDPRTPPRPEVYLSTARFASSERDLIVRGTSTAKPEALLASLTNAVASIDPAVPLYRATVLEASVTSLLARDRFTTFLLGAFASLALLLAAIGVYGVLSGDVASRRKEIGIRLALGAAPAGVTRLVVRRAVRPTLYGIALGVVAAVAVTRAMSAMVFGVGTTDPRSFAGVVALLIAVASLATFVPAFRAARVSPLEAIRTD